MLYSAYEVFCEAAAHQLGGFLLMSTQGVEEEFFVPRRIDGLARPLPQPRAIQPPVAVEPASAPLTEPRPEQPAVAPRRRITWKRAGIAASAMLVLFMAAAGLKLFLASRRIITHNNSPAPALVGAVDPTKLKGEGDGRINILLLGVGGQGHDGADLSDTIMVASIDPVKKTVAMLSIPRDLYVKIPGYGYGKINAADSYGGPELAKQVVSNILDLPIHYYVQVDFSGFKQAVDAVGGVEVTNPSDLYDPAYPCDNERGYCPFTLKAGTYHMDGSLALKFARCRHGSCGNDFGRAARQQLLLVALRQKALQLSTLTNPVKLNGLIDTVSGHVKTDFQPKEVNKMASIVKDLDVAHAAQKVLDNQTTGTLVDGANQFPGAGSILLPKAGPFDYSQIQELAHSLFVDSYLKSENAGVEVQNGTYKDGLAGAVAKQLEAYQYNVVGTSNATDHTHTTSQIIDYSGGKKPYTLKYLKQRFGASVTTQPKPTALAPGETQIPDIVVVVGSNYKVSASALSSP